MNPTTFLISWPHHTNASTHTHTHTPAHTQTPMHTLTHTHTQTHTQEILYAQTHTFPLKSCQVRDFFISYNGIRLQRSQTACITLSSVAVWGLLTMYRSARDRLSNFCDAHTMYPSLIKWEDLTIFSSTCIILQQQGALTLCYCCAK